MRDVKQGETVKKKTNQYVKSQYHISLKNGNVPKIHDNSRKTSRFEPFFPPFLRAADEASVLFSADTYSGMDSMSR
jgi:hypothetical protein